MSSENSNIVTSFLIWMLFISFSCLIALVWDSQYNIWTKVMKLNILVKFQILKRKKSAFLNSFFCYLLAYYRCFSYRKEYHNIVPNAFNILMMKLFSILLNVFSPSIEKVTWLLFLMWLMCSFTFTDLYESNYPFFLG
jgi:hypothetical protein